VVEAMKMSFGDDDGDSQEERKKAVFVFLSEGGERESQAYLYESPSPQASDGMVDRQADGLSSPTLASLAHRRQTRTPNTAKPHRPEEVFHAPKATLYTTNLGQGWPCGTAAPSRSYQRWNLQAMAVVVGSGRGRAVEPVMDGRDRLRPHHASGELL